MMIGSAIFFPNLSEFTNKEQIQNDLCLGASDPTAFISVWNTSAPGESLDTQISLPLEVGGDYNFTVNWGDTSENNITAYDQAEITHTYSAEGKYTVNITGYIQGWCYDDAGDYLKILEIKQADHNTIFSYGINDIIKNIKTLCNSL